MSDDLHDVLPRSAGDMLALAERAVRRYWREPTASNLLPMVLTTSHVADWYVHADLGLRRGVKFRDEFQAAYPKWNAIRQVGNGIKHPGEVQLVTRASIPISRIYLAHRDFLRSEIYSVEFEGAWIPVCTLCKEFIEDFSGDVMSGNVRSKMPGIHDAYDRGRGIEDGTRDI